MRLLLSALVLLVVSCGQKEATAVHLEAVTVRENEMTLTAVIFDRRKIDLVVADKTEGPESSWQSAQAAGQENNALAAINGGFFDKKGKPIGIVISDGTRRGSINKTDLGSAFFLDSPARLVTRKDVVNKKLFTKSQHAIQCGPRLLWRGKATTGLNSERVRPRSFLLWDGQRRLAIGHASAATLAKLSETLASQPFRGFKITHALNLDGGSSSDLWVSNKVPGGGLVRRSLLNKPVRNYLLLKERE